VPNGDIEYKKVTNYTNIIKLTNTGKYLHKIRCKWNNKVRRAQTPLRESKHKLENGLTEETRQQI
jgi:hypothetical protein